MTRVAIESVKANTSQLLNITINALWKIVRVQESKLYVDVDYTLLASSGATKARKK